MLQAAAQEPPVNFVEGLGIFVSFMSDTAATSMANWSHRVTYLVYSIYGNLDVCMDPVKTLVQDAIS